MTPEMDTQKLYRQFRNRWVVGYLASYTATAAGGLAAAIVTQGNKLIAAGSLLGGWGAVGYGLYMDTVQKRQGTLIREDFKSAMQEVFGVTPILHPKKWSVQVDATVPVAVDTAQRLEAFKRAAYSFGMIDSVVPRNIRRASRAVGTLPPVRLAVKFSRETAHLLRTLKTHHR
jgi:hypothetical protein